MSTTAIHESAHAAVAVALGKRVRFIERDPGHVLVGEQAGFVSIDLASRPSISGRASIASG